MKKFCALLFVIMMLLALPVSAEKVKFKDSNCNFTGYSSIYMMGISPLQLDQTDFVADYTADSKVRMTLLSAFADKKIRMEETLQENALSPKLGFDVKIYVFGYDKIWHDAWVETVNTTKTIVITKYRNGREEKETISVPDVQYVQHPAGYYYTARVDLAFNVTDQRTGRLVYSLRDTRSRGGETDTSGMLKRICNDFVKDITKN